MSHVCEVRDLGNGRSHWTVKGPAGTRLDWGAVVTQLIPGKLIAWKTEQGSLVQHAGSVYFEESNGGTRLTVRMSYNVAGGLGNLIAMLLGSDPRKKVDDDLMRMKMFIETGVPPHDAASRGGAVLSSQPYGEHSSFEP